MEQTKLDWMALKASIADAFATVYKAGQDGVLADRQVENLNLCLCALNEYLEEYPPKDETV